MRARRNAARIEQAESVFEISPIGILGLAAVAMCWSLAAWLYRVGTPGSVARRLSLLLFVEGVTLGSTGYIDLFLGPATRAHALFPQWLRIEELVHTLGDCTMLVLYPLFLSAALQTPLMRPFESARVRQLIMAIAGVLFVAVLWGPMKIAATALYLALSALFGFALVASVHAWRTASGPAKARARSFAIAFGIRDVCWGFAYLSAIGMLWSGTYLLVDPDASGLPYIVYALGTLLAVPLIAYGILKTQLFDIDLRIRWTIKQSTLAASFVAIVYVVTEGADRVLAEELGNVVGLLVSALVVFFLAPLQRFAERVAATAMPNTSNTTEYVTFRKLQVYEGALQEALQGGGISDKERALLNRLRDSLGITAADAEALERDLHDQATLA